MIDFNVAYDKIAQFKSADEIANYLNSCGIKAEKGVPDACAISVWMRDQTGLRILTNSGECWSAGPDNMFDALESRRNTLAVHTFVESFDSGLYPELEAPLNRVWSESKGNQPLIG